MQLPKRPALRLALLAGASAAFLSTLACGGASSLLGGTAKGFVTYLERVVSGAVAVYVLRRMDGDTGVVEDLNSYADLGFEWLFEGPSDALFSLIPDGSGAKIVRLAASGPVDVGALGFNPDLAVAAKDGIAVVRDATPGAAESLVIQTQAYGGGAPASTFTGALGQDAQITSLAADRSGDGLFFSGLLGSLNPAGEEQIFQVAGGSATPLAAKFSGRVMAIAHATVSGEAFVYGLEETGSGTRVVRVKVASPAAIEQLGVFPGTIVDGMAASADSSSIGFTLLASGTRKAFRISGTVIEEIAAPTSPGVAGVVLN